MDWQSEYALGDLPARRFDPRARLIGALVWSVAVALAQTLLALIIALAASLAILAFARVRPRSMLLQLAFVNIFVGALWLLIPWSVPGTTVWSTGPLNVTREGLLLAGCITLRSNAIVCACIALLTTMRLSEFAQALLAIRVPHKLVAITWSCVHFLYVVHDEYLRILTAVRLRGFVPRTSPHTYRTVANVAGLLLVRSDDRAERVRDAMLCRGFDGRIRSLAQPELRPRDVALVSLLAIAAMSLLVLEWT